MKYCKEFDVITSDDFEVKDRVVKLKDGLYYERMAQAHADDDFTAEDAEKQDRFINEFNNQFSAQVIKESGEIAQGMMVEDKELKFVDSSAKFGRDRSLRVQHKREITTFGKVTRGSTTVKLTSGISMKDGPIGSARDELRRLAEERLKSE